MFQLGLQQAKPAVTAAQEFSCEPHEKLGDKPQTLVRGVTPQFALSLPAGAIQFGSLEFAKRHLREHLGDLVGAASVNLMAGSRSV